MVAEPEIALVFTPETWVEELHRFVTDHGGARVRHVVVDPAVALDEPYDALVVSWRWPALTRGLVDELHLRGRAVLGVYDREEPVGRDLLRAAAVDAVVASDASMVEVLARLAEMTAAPERGRGADTCRAASVRSRGDGAPGWVAVGGPAGAGTTEVAIELARALGAGAVLVDADEVAPSVAARLALPIEPNLRSAIDAVEYGLGTLAETLVPASGAALAALTGLASVSLWPQVRPPEVLRVLRALTTVVGRGPVIVDTSAPVEDLATPQRGRYAVTRAVLAEAAAVVAVGQGSPVGVVRLLGWIADARALRPDGAFHVVVNRVPGDVHRRSQIATEITRACVPASLTLVPDDARVHAAEWSGTVIARGPFRKALAPLARQCAHVVARGAWAAEVAV